MAVTCRTLKKACSLTSLGAKHKIRFGSFGVACPLICFRQPFAATGEVNWLGWVMGVEPTSDAYHWSVLPLHHTHHRKQDGLWERASKEPFPKPYCF